MSVRRESLHLWEENTACSAIFITITISINIIITTIIIITIITTTICVEGKSPGVGSNTACSFSRSTLHFAHNEVL